MRVFLSHPTGITRNQSNSGESNRGKTSASRRCIKGTPLLPAGHSGSIEKEEEERTATSHSAGEDHLIQMEQRKTGDCQGGPEVDRPCYWHRGMSRQPLNTCECYTRVASQSLGSVAAGRETRAIGAMLFLGRQTDLARLSLYRQPGGVWMAAPNDSLSSPGTLRPSHHCIGDHTPLSCHHVGRQRAVFSFPRQEGGYIDHKLCTR